MSLRPHSSSRRFRRPPARSERLDLPLGGEPAPRSRQGPAVRARPVPGPRRRPRRRGPWRWLAALLLLALVAAVVVYLLVLAPPRPLVEPATVAFEPQRVGRESEPLALRIANEGRRELVVGDLRVEGADAAAFAVVSGDCLGVPLPHRATCIVQVGFTPARPGEHEARLDIVSNASEPTLAVGLAGRGTAPSLAVSPARVDFGRVAVGQTSEGAALELTNPGDAALEIRSVGVSGRGERSFRWLANACSGKTLGPAESCAVRIAFQPLAGGEETVRLTVDSDAEETPEVELHGIGLAPGLLVLPERLTLGSVRLGSAGATETVTLENTGNAPLRIGAVALDGPGRQAFELDGASCAAAVLAPGGTCRLRVTLRPRDEGAFRASIRIASPDLGRSSSVALEGRATAPRLRVSSPGFDFGRVVVGAAETEQLRVESVGSEPVTLTGLALDGTGFDAQGECRRGMRLEPGAGCRLEVRFAPRAEGAATGRLRLQHDGLGPTVEIALAGSGYPPPVAAIEIAPRQLEFEPVTVGGRSDILSLRIRSVGNARLELRDLRVEGEHAADFVMVPASCNGIPYLVPGSDCVVGFRFMPQGPGERRARLVVRSNSGDGTVGVPMLGLAAGPPGP